MPHVYFSQQYSYFYQKQVLSMDVTTTEGPVPIFLLSWPLVVVGLRS